MDKKLEIGCLVKHKTDKGEKAFVVKGVETCWWDKTVGIYDNKGIFYPAEEYDVIGTPEEVALIEPFDQKGTDAERDSWYGFHTCDNNFGDTVECGLGSTETVEIPQAFIKHDQDKPMVSLVEAPFVLSMASVLTSGAKKYTPDNWKNCNDTQRYKDAALRHIYSYLGGEKNDPETGKSHLIHAACNLMFLFYFDNKG